MKKKRSDESLDSGKILKFLSADTRYPLQLKEILLKFDVDKERRGEVKGLLEDMVAKGEIVRIKGGRYGIPSKMNLVVGKLQGHREGFGFVIPDEGEGDIYIRQRGMAGAMHGDKVVARVEGSRRGGKREGSIIRVIDRANRVIIGKYEKGKGFGYLMPQDDRIQDIYIPKGCSSDADDGEVVLAEITAYPVRKRSPEGRVVRVLGKPDDPEVEIEAIVLKHGLPHIFPEDVLAEAEAVGEEVGRKELEGRRDLRDLLTVTIDGETARDFDDAVSVRREEGGDIRLWVSIADVSHYVYEGSALDREALERSTSVYFPDRCIPMLPERLSNGICSLNPDVYRLSVTAEMLFNDRGERTEESFYPSVIKSDFRMTYTEVKNILVDEDEKLINRYERAIPDLKVMEELQGRLAGYRRARGCIDFDLPEAQVVIDIQGGVEAIVRSERNLAHMIIEEFMLAANEAVASFLTREKTPFPYRVHEEPDEEKLEAFREFIHNFGYSLGKGKPGPKDLQRILGEVSGKPEERTINHVLLRSMKQAVYSGKNIGHFGLASDEYCHFTSPIRRYPDLIVHRALKETLKKGGLKKSKRERMAQILPAMCENTSGRERRAMEAEREVVDLKKVQFMKDKVGGEYSGFITGVVSFGFFVELEELFVEGLVHISSIDDDYYFHDEKNHALIGNGKKRRFAIGDEVKVKVDRVDVEKRQIDFTLI